MPLKRCEWARSEPNISYHDREWGTPVHDDTVLFEFLILEGAQAGLSWETILRKRDNYRKAFHSFDAARIARYGARDTARLLADPGIVRNRAKIAAAVGNARAVLALRKEFGSLDAYLWSFVEGAPIVNRRRRAADVPAETPLSERISRDLHARDFRFVGPTIIYAFMQAVGMVNDHRIDCFRYAELAGKR
ncbi:MAG TPA: DNA-3-methyladenine glycosylase I [Candidatus Baltobacteraceae bacterium]|nr:DNA-3-methyladenine glycosylase I [Candidatus Baltobacteraceae bacterium]